MQNTDFVKNYLRAFKQVKAFYPRFPLHFFFISILFIFISLISTYTPFFLRQATNEIGEKGSVFYLYALAYAGCWTIENILQNVKGIFSAGVLARSDASLNKSFLNSIFSYSYLQERKLDVGSTAQDIDRAAAAFSALTISFFWTIVPLFFEFFSILAILSSSLSFKFSILFGGSTISLSLIAYYIASKSENIHSSIFSAQNNVQSYTIERLGALTDLRINLAQDKELKVANHHLSQMVQAIWSANLKMGIYLGAQALSIGIVLGVFTIYSAHLDTSNQLTSGDFAMIAGYVAILTVQLRFLSGALIDLKRNQVALTRGLAFFPDERPIPARSDNHVPQKTDRLFFVNNVTLGLYGKVLLRNFSCSFRKGELSVISAPSGRGKTTLIHAMLGFLPCTEGHIEIYGIPIHLLQSKNVFEYVAFAPQAVSIFSSSLRFNLLYGVDRHVPDEELLYLLKEFEFTSSSTQNFESILDEAVGTGGRLLSGGERQRISILRALLREKSVLILDEPTASLNLNLGKKIIGFIASKVETIIVITHDTHIAEMADNLIELPMQ